MEWALYLVAVILAAFWILDKLVNAIDWVHPRIFFGEGNRDRAINESFQMLPIIIGVLLIGSFIWLYFEGRDKIPPYEPPAPVKAVMHTKQSSNLAHATHSKHNKSSSSATHSVSK